MVRLVLILVVFVFRGECLGEEEGVGGTAKQIAEIRKNFEELRDDLFSAQRKFDVRYEGKLKELEKKATAAGNLNLVLAAREEAKTFRERNGKGPETPSSFVGLARLQGIHAAESARIAAERESKLAGLEGGYRTKLVGLRTGFTKSKRIPEALLVDAEIKLLESGGMRVGRGVAPPVVAATDPTVPKPDAGGDFDKAIPGFAFGEPGKVRGFGIYKNGSEMEMNLIGDLDDIIEVNADAGVYWNVLSRSKGHFYRGGNRKQPAIRMGRGERNSGGILILEGGKLWHCVQKEIEPSRFGGGTPVEVAIAGGVYLVLKEDGTIHFYGGAPGAAKELNELIGAIDDVVAVDGSFNHLYALTGEGNVMGWNVFPPAGGSRLLDLTCLKENIVAIESHFHGVCALDRDGKVWWTEPVGNGKFGAIEPKDGKLENIRRIWAGGACGVALDKDGKLHAWAKDRAGVGFVEKIEALKGFKGLAVMDRAINLGTADEVAVTHALWIE